MRKIICLTMILFFVITVITGFAEAHVHPGRSGIHTPMAILFVVFILTHMIINRKSIARHMAVYPRKPASE
jgi:hypothetical protein